MHVSYINSSRENKLYSLLGRTQTSMTVTYAYFDVNKKHVCVSPLNKNSK